jgi:hypothetical protein
MKASSAARAAAVAPAGLQVVQPVVAEPRVAVAVRRMPGVEPLAVVRAASRLPVVPQAAPQAEDFLVVVAAVPVVG